MKPSPKNRCARTLVRDFLVGLAVFLTVFTLAMLDSRASHSAPAFVSKPATTALFGEFTPMKVSMRGRGFLISENGAADFEASGLTSSMPYARELASENFPVTFPVEKMNTGLPGSGGDAEPVGKNPKLAMNISKRGLGSPALTGKHGAEDRTWTLTIMAMIFAVMTALTLGLWRHLRHSVAPRRTGRRV